MTEVWDATAAFLKRERALVVPVALATFALSGVINTTIRAQAQPGTSNPLLVIGMFLALLLFITGQLALTAMTLRPGITVGEAMREGASRLMPYLGLMLLLMLALTVALIPVGVALVQAGIDPGNPQQLKNAPGWISVYLLLLIPIVVWVALRMALAGSFIIDRSGPVQAIRQSAATMKGRTLKLLGAALVYSLVAFVVVNGVRFIVGSLIALIANAAGTPDIGVMATTIIVESITAIFTAISTVFLAMLYLRVVPRA